LVFIGNVYGNTAPKEKGGFNFGQNIELSSLDIAPEKLDRNQIIKVLNMLQQVRVGFDKEIENKKKECLGEFNSVEIGNEGESKSKIKKLTNEEKELCFKRLKTFLNRYTHFLFEVRKKILTKLMSFYSIQLEEDKKSELIRIENIFRKKQRSKKRKRK
jgi:hypothetical protein